MSKENMTFGPIEPCQIPLVQGLVLEWFVSLLILNNILVCDEDNSIHAAQEISNLLLFDIVYAEGSKIVAQSKGGDVIGYAHWHPINRGPSRFMIKDFFVYKNDQATGVRMLQELKASIKRQRGTKCFIQIYENDKTSLDFFLKNGFFLMKSMISKRPATIRKKIAGRNVVYYMLGLDLSLPNTSTNH